MEIQRVSSQLQSTWTVTAFIVQVPRRFASIASRTRVQDSLRVADNPGFGPLIATSAFFVIDWDQVQSQKFIQYAYVDLRSVPNLR